MVDKVEPGHTFPRALRFLLSTARHRRSILTPSLYHRRHINSTIHSVVIKTLLLYPIHITKKFLIITAMLADWYIVSIFSSFQHSAAVSQSVVSTAATFKYRRGVLKSSQYTTVRLTVLLPFWHIIVHLLMLPAFNMCSGLEQSVQRLATGWTVQGSNPGGGEIFRTRPDRSWGPPSLLFNGYRVFHGGKAAGAWRWPLTPSSAEVERRVELYVYSPFGPVLGRVLRLPLPLPLLIYHKARKEKWSWYLKKTQVCM